jgi:antitoxin component YwqK of YwqJK toxin-antitoxin module
MPVKKTSSVTKKQTSSTKAKKPAAGEYIKYHNDGSIWARGKMKGDQQDGYWEWYRKDGVIMRSGYFENGKQAGEWTTYDKRGKVYKITKMKVLK